MIKYYIQNGNCGTETAFKIIGAKWKSQILNFCNSNQNISYYDLKQELGNVTDSVLTKQLNELTKDGMLTKQLFEKKKNKTVYTITEKTRDIVPSMQLMDDFATLCGYDRSDYNSKIEYTKYLIGSKWKSRIIWAIYNHETIRFNELLNCIEGLSHKILIEHLNTFTANNLVKKTDYNEKSPRVEYSLTTNGEKAYEIIKSLSDWCLKYELIKPYIEIHY